MSGNKFDHLSMRLVYEKGAQVMKEAGCDVTTAKGTISSLRFEQALATTSATYTFGVTNVDNGPAGTRFNTEFRLNQQDAFLVSEIALYLAAPSSATDATYVDCTYPSPAIFATGSAALGVIYHGSIKLTVNNVVIVPTLSTSRFRKVPFAQKVTAAANQNGIAFDSFDMSCDGLAISEPNMYFIGSKGNLLQLNMPAAPATLDANTRVILEVHGLLWQNVTVVS